MDTWPESALPREREKEKGRRRAKVMAAKVRTTSVTTHTMVVAKAERAARVITNMEIPEALWNAGVDYLWNNGNKAKNFALEGGRNWITSRLDMVTAYVLQLTAHARSSAIDCTMPSYLPRALARIFMDGCTGHVAL